MTPAAQLADDRRKLDEAEKLMKAARKQLDAKWKKLHQECKHHPSQVEFYSRPHGYEPVGGHGMSLRQGLRFIAECKTCDAVVKTETISEVTASHPEKSHEAFRQFKDSWTQHYYKEHERVRVLEETKP